MENMFKSNTVKVLTIIGTLLLALYTMGDSLVKSELLSEQGVEYIKIVLTLLETTLGVKFRLDAEEKPPLDVR